MDLFAEQLIYTQLTLHNSRTSHGMKTLSYYMYTRNNHRNPLNKEQEKEPKRLPIEEMC